jgi:O-methyltransferase involved in polyketide biosynthesis
MKIGTEKINGVPETMLYTFYMRYLESKRPDGLINDPVYEKIIRQIDFDYSRFEPYSRESPLYFACRSLLFDDAVKKFIARNPRSRIVSFGSGLDFRFDRVDNGRIHWYDIDLPEVIEIRKQLFSESKRLHFISSSALDTAWSSLIDNTGPILFLAEGLFIYFDPGEIKTLLSFLTSSYPGSMLLLDTATTLYVNIIRQGTPYKYLNRMCALWKWSINGAYEFEDYAAGITVVETWNTMSMYGSRMPGDLENLFAAEELPGFVKEQIAGMNAIYLLKLGPMKKGGDLQTEKNSELPDINLSDLYI